MRTIDLFLSILRDVRYSVMNKGDISLNDFEFDSKGYQLLVSFNDAANKFSELINIMDYERILNYKE